MRKKNIIIIITLIIAIILLRAPIQNLVSKIFIPFTKTGTWITNSVSTNKRIEILEKQRNDLAVEKSELEQLRQENQNLYEQINFIKKHELRNVSANIIARTNSKQINRFVIDKGSNDGITTGSSVIVGNGILVGKIININKETATVMGLSDVSMATATTLLNETRTLGIAEGTLGNLIKLKFIPNDQTIRINDLLITSGLEENIPDGLLIGIIISIKKDPTAAFQEAIAEPLADIRKHSIVSVIVPDPVL